MDFDAYWDLVERGEWPEDRSVPLPEAFRNDAGAIQNLCLRPVTSVAVIHSRPGTRRANHWHRTDWHFAYVVSGEVVYFERPVGSSEDPLATARSFPAGTMFFTPPGVEHCMFFPVETTFVTLARNVRSHESHEADLVRVELVSALQAQAYLARRA